MAARSRAGVVGSAVERVRLALAVPVLEPEHLDRPVDHRITDGHVAHPLDHQVAVGDLVLVGRLGDGQPDRPFAVRRRSDRQAVVLIGEHERDRRLGGLDLSGGRVVHRDAGAIDHLVVQERHAVVVAGGHVDRLLRRHAADEGEQIGELDALDRGWRRDRPGAVLQAAPAGVGGQRLELGHGERLRLAVAGDREDDRVGRLGGGCAAGEERAGEEHGCDGAEQQDRRADDEAAMSHGLDLSLSWRRRPTAGARVLGGGAAGRMGEKPPPRRAGAELPPAQNMSRILTIP